MAEATVTSKGQITIPAEIRSAMGLKAQDRVVFTLMPDGTTVTSERPVVALCACRRTKRYPFCDTSHRRKIRPAQTAESARDTNDDSPDDQAAVR